jgi:uncharacterized protein (UPF0261 family)
MNFPVPTGDMKLMYLTDVMIYSKTGRGGQTLEELNKIKLLENFIRNNYYCRYLKK